MEIFARHCLEYQYFNVGSKSYLLEIGLMVPDFTEIVSLPESWVGVEGNSITPKSDPISELEPWLELKKIIWN